MNSDSSRELMQNNTTHVLPEFISNNTETIKEILPYKTRVTPNADTFHVVNSDTSRELMQNNNTHFFSEFISNNTEFSES